MRSCVVVQLCSCVVLVGHFVVRGTSSDCMFPVVIQQACS